jgi:hypothetical protein
MIYTPKKFKLRLMRDKHGKKKIIIPSSYDFKLEEGSIKA